MITLSKDVGYTLRQMFRHPANTKMFIPTWGDGQYHEAFHNHHLYITSICQIRETLKLYFPAGEVEDNNQRSFYDEQRRIEVNPRIELYRPENQFHYGFAFNNFSLTRDYTHSKEGQVRVVSPVLEDSMLYFECSKNTLSQDRTAMEHFITMEQMYRACMVGGYFAAVLPKRWAGNNMRYVKGWNDTVATVARVTLPPEAVRYSPEELDQVGLTEAQAYADKNLKWELIVWMKPSPRLHRNHPVLHAELRWPVFVYTRWFELGKTDREKERETATIVKSFKRHDWWVRSVDFWLEMLKTRSTHADYGTTDSAPVELIDPALTKIFKATPKTRPGYAIADTITQIADDPYGIHIKPGPPVKVRAYNPTAIAMWHDIETSAETVQIPPTDKKPGKSIWKLSADLRRKHFANCKEEFVKQLQQKGFNPYLLRSDLNRLKKQEKWLSIQLTPVERAVRTVVVDPEDEAKKKEEWDFVYSDVGLQATHPELWNMWLARGRKMKLDKFEFDFQFKDAVTMACHWSILNSNVMGLGKTIQLLVNQLFLGVRHGLYVVPSKLLGVWTDEIQGNIARFVQRSRRHWSGARMYADYQIIEWGAQTLPSKLATFNLISYEKLVTIPKDTLFFRCPKCGFVAASVKRVERQPCPSPDCENHGRRKRIKEVNRIRGLRKRKVMTAEGVRVIDERVHPGPLVMMEQLTHREKRMSRVFKGMESMTIPHPALQGETIEVVSPIYSEEEKKVHLRWTFADLLRNAFNYVGVDEAVNIKNPDAKRSKAVTHLTPRHRIPATGTPIRGYPQSVLSMLNWTFKRAVFPDYRLEDRGAESRWLEKYGTKVLNTKTGKWKLIPKANNPEQLQAELAPLMVRHLREEPAVVQDIPPKKSIRELIALPMDEYHRAYYEKWLEKFKEWFIEKKKEEGKRATGGEILVKIGYLFNASSIPHSMFDNMLRNAAKKKKKKTGTSTMEVDADGAAWAAIIGPYKGPPTQKQVFTRNLITAIKDGADMGIPGTDRTLSFPGREKILAGSLRRANLDAGQLWAQQQKNPPIYSMIVDGRISNKIQENGKSRKHEMVQQFCEMEYDVMWAGIKALAEGHNIPCANHAIHMDYDWEPSTHRQFVGRMLRPQQENVVNEYFLSHFGTMDDYMAALCILKGKSMDEVIDFMEFPDFSVELIPDIQQYAEAIVDGTHHIERAKMWLAAEEILRKEREGSEDED